MYQSIIRDPGGDSLIRIQPDLCTHAHSVVNGSILLVPPETTAFVAINGILSRPYGPGRHEIFTGVDPFFVRFRHLMTGGDPGISVSVYFISTEKHSFLTFGTGELPFQERRFQITMKALASCSLSFSIENPRTTLSKLVGSYRSAFTEDEMNPCIEQLALMPIRKALSQELSHLDVTEFNSKLNSIGAAATESIRTGFSEYGLKLLRFRLTAVNIPKEEMDRLYRLEQTCADGKIRIDQELDHLRRVWNGNINDRTLSEMLTGIVSRGQAPSETRNTQGGAGGMVPMMMLLSQVLPNLREPFSSIISHTDLFRGTSPAQETPSSAESPRPPLPPRRRRCPSCNADVPRSARVCSVCGYRFQ